MIINIFIGLSILQLSLQSGTYLYFDGDGIQNLTRAIIKSEALSQDRSFELNQELSFLVGTLTLKDAKIHGIDLDPAKFNVNLDPQHNALNLDLQTDILIISANISLSLFGITLGDGPINIRVEGTQLEGKLVFERRESDGGLKFGFMDQNIVNFKTGKIKIFGMKSWWRKLIATIANPLTNLILSALSGNIGQIIAKEVEKLGSQIPATISLGGAYQGVVVPLNLTQNPSIGDGKVRFDFACGQIESNQDESYNYVNFGLSEKCVNDLLQQIYSITPSPINVSAIAQQISEVTEINTKTLGGLFPGFQKLGIPQDVKLEVALNLQNKPSVRFDPMGMIIVQAPISIRMFLLQTQQLSTMGLNLNDKILMLLQQKFQEIHYTDFNLTAEVNIGFVKAFGGFALSLQEIDSSQYEQTEQARQKNLFDEQNWEDIKEVGLSFAMSFANQVLYQTLVNIHGVLDLKQLQIQVVDKEIRLEFKFD